MPLTKQQIVRCQAAEIYWTGRDGVRLQLDSGPNGLPPELAPSVWGFAPGLLRSRPRENESPAKTPDHNDLVHRIRQAKIAFEEAEFVVEGERHAGVLAKGISRTKAVAIGYKMRLWMVFGLTANGWSVVYTGHNSRDRRA